MNEALTWLTEPFQYPFMLRALWASLIVGVVCPVLGTYVVLRGMAFLGDALAHIILPGVVLAFLLGLPLAVGALAVGVLAALAINAISARAELRQDAAIGVVFAGAFALGVALLSLQRSYAVDLTHILFGDLLGVSSADLGLMGALGRSCCWSWWPSIRSSWFCPSTHFWPRPCDCRFPSLRTCCWCCWRS